MTLKCHCESTGDFSFMKMADLAEANAFLDFEKSISSLRAKDHLKVKSTTVFSHLN